MQSSLLARSALAGACLSAVCLAQTVVINEFSYDDSGTDDREFVELYNPATAPVDISGWTLQCTDYVNPGNNPDYVIPGTPGSMTYVIPAGGYFVIGASIVPNVNLVITHPTTGLEQDLFEDGPDALVLREPGGLILDAVAYEWVVDAGADNWETNWGEKHWEGFPIWGTFINIDFHEQSRSRLRDGYDTDNNARDFILKTATPGASNNTPNLLPYFQDFSALLPTNATNGDVLVPGWSASFIEPVCIDPTQLDMQGYNLNVLTPSPNGGNAGSFAWDPAGGGNFIAFECDPQSELLFEAYVWIDVTALPPAGEYYVWSIGMCGTSDTYFNLPNVVGSFASTYNNNTGVSWTLEVTSAGAGLHLVDHNEGGQNSARDLNPLRVLGSIPLHDGVNPLAGYTTAGWHRISMKVSGGVAEGRFGGTYGVADGTLIEGAVEDGAQGSVYMGYRENLTNYALGHPPILDAILINDPSGRITPFGQGTATTVDTPYAGGTSWPTVGNSAFAVEIGDVLPMTPVALLVGTPFAAPIDVSFIGTQPGTILYINTLFSAVGGSDGTGIANFPAAIPNVPALAGGSISFQAITIDLALPYSIAIANTGGLEVVIGT